MLRSSLNCKTLISSIVACFIILCMAFPAFAADNNGLDNQSDFSRAGNVDNSFSKGTQEQTDTSFSKGTQDQSDNSFSKGTPDEENDSFSQGMADEAENTIIAPPAQTEANQPQIEETSEPDIASADPDYLKSLVEQGKGYYYGTGPEGYNRDKAEQCFKEAADGNYGEGWYYLGNMYMNSLMDQPYERAMECYQKAVDCGFGLGLVCQALLYENGLGVEQDFAKAYELYSAAGEVGLREGYCGLGSLYKDGSGVLQDELAAMEFYKMALDSQDFMWRNFAKCMIGKMYEEGAPGISQDYSQAMDWYLQAAEEGYGRGYCCIGDMYYYGNGVEKDQGEAFKWYKQAAEHGNVTGMYDAGFLLDHARGVTQDYTEAMKYYRMAAGIGDASAMYALGCMYEEGHGVSKDYEQARYWLEQALKYAGDDMGLKEAIGEEMAYISSGVY